MPWEIPNILSRINETNDFYFDSVSQIRMKNWCSQRVALIGDAAACASLLAGEGTGLAMIEAYVLAGELYQAKGDYRLAFKNYEDRLQKFIQKKQKSALQMISFFAPESRFKLALAKIVLKASSLPILSHLFLGRLAKDKIDLPNYLGPE
jgi:2-polyprenyl-6-methoxyphenol hydroxylase-like FAD-dependent oxidoreductase